MGVMLYLVLHLYQKRCPSAQSYLIQLSLKKLVVLRSTAFLGLGTVQGTGWTSEMPWWSSFRFLSASYMNIWKKSIHIINSFGKSVLPSKNRNLFHATRNKEMQYFEFIDHVIATHLVWMPKYLPTSSPIPPSSKDTNGKELLVKWSQKLQNCSWLKKTLWLSNGRKGQRKLIGDTWLLCSLVKQETTRSSVLEWS